MYINVGLKYLCSG